jgi:hypothetical protein
MSEGGHFTAGMSNRGSPEGHMSHICIVMRATLDMPDIEYVFFIQNVFYIWKYSIIFPSVKIILKACRFSVNDARLSSLNYKNCNFGR